MVKERVDIQYNVETKGANKGLSSLKSSFAGVIKLLSNPILLGAAVVAGIAKIGKASLKAAAQLEQYQISFEVMLGSAEKAKALLAEINEVAVKTPFEQSSIIKSTQSLLAFGVAQEDVIKTFKVLGDISQGDAAKLDGLTRAYGKVQAKGKASMEEIQMVAEKGVPIIGELANTMGVTTEEVFKLSQQGKISSADFNKAMSSMTEEGSIFYGSMDKQSQTLTGQFSTFKGNVELLAQSLGEYLLPAAKAVVGALNKMLGGMIKVGGAIKEFFDKRKEEREEQALTDDERAERDIERVRSTEAAKAKIEQAANLKKIKELAKMAAANKKVTDKMGKAYIASVQAQADSELSIAGQVAQGTLDYVKKQLIASVAARSAQLASEGMAELPLLLLGNPSGVLKLLAAGTMQAAGQTAINSIKLQEGGIVEPQNGGVNATLGEAGGAEAVIPLDEIDETSEGAAGALGGGSVGGTIILENGDELAKFVYQKNTDQLRTGELQGR